MSANVIKPYVSKKKRKLIEQEKEENIETKLSKTDVKSIFITNKEVWAAIQNPKLASPRHVCGRKKICDTPVWDLKWCPKFSHLLAATNGKSCTLYDAISNDSLNPVFRVQDSENIVRCIHWSTKGRRLATCAYDKTIKIIDFMSDGRLLLDCTIEERPNVIRWWNNEDSLLLVGGENNYLKSFDIRTGKEAVSYPTKSGNIIAADFFTDGERFVSSGDLASRESSEHSIAVWDGRTGAKLSDQMYHERYSCPCVRVHPSGASFLAQTNGDYIARFTTNHPYRMDKTIRYENHKVRGYPVQFDLSSDGCSIASGCATGSVKIYQYKTSALIKNIHVTTNTSITAVEWNPQLSNVLAVGDWSGSVYVIK